MIAGRAHERAIRFEIQPFNLRFSEVVELYARFPGTEAGSTKLTGGLVRLQAVKWAERASLPRVSVAWAHDRNDGCGPMEALAALMQQAFCSVPPDLLLAFKAT